MKNNSITLKKGIIGYLSLTVLAISTIVGSGWFFGIYKAVKFAGPVSIVSWILGGFAMLMIALAALEVGTIFPKVGGFVHYLNITHGPIAGFISAFTCWIVISLIIAFEALISTQYLATFNFSNASCLFDSHRNILTGEGLAVAALFLLLYFYLNYWTVNFMIRCNNVIAFLKLLVPLITAFAFIICGFMSPSVASVRTTFAPYGWNAAFTAITSCGIVFAFNGFQSVLSLAEEVKDPGENFPIAIISSIIFCIVLYILLQIAFIIALTPETLAIDNWQSLSLNSPFTQLAMVFNLNFIMVSLYVNSVISPSGTGMIHVAGVSRMLVGMQQYKQMPKFVGKIHSKYRVPRNALLFNFLICLVLLFIFKKWDNILGAVSVGCVITYIAGPIATSTLRKDAPHLKRPFKLFGERVISPLAFILCTLFLYWAYWELMTLLIIFILSGFFFYIIFSYRENRKETMKYIKSSLWLISYLIVINFLSLIGGTDFRGLGYLPNGYDNVIIVFVALFFFYWAINSGCYKSDSESEECRIRDEI